MTRHAHRAASADQYTERERTHRGRDSKRDSENERARDSERNYSADGSWSGVGLTGGGGMGVSVNVGLRGREVRGGWGGGSTTLLAASDAGARGHKASNTRSQVDIFKS